MTAVPPMDTKVDAERELEERVRAAVADDDRGAALRLLRDLVEGSLDAASLSALLGDALVATASGSQSNGRRPAAQKTLQEVDDAREHVIKVLQGTPFGKADLRAIRAVLDWLDADAEAAAEDAQRKDLEYGLAPGSRRVGSVWLEVKYIPDAVSGKRYGPYLYGRWRNAGRKRSRYIGKAPASGG